MLYAVRYVQYYVVRHSVIVGPFPDPPVGKYGVAFFCVSA